MKNNINLWLAAGLLAAPFYFTLIIILGAVEPGFSHLTIPMSMLGGVPGMRGQVFNFGVAVTGLLVIAFGVGLGRQLPPKKTAKLGCGLLIIGGLGLMGAGYFHCNEGCINIFSEPDLIGRLHIIMSLLSGMGTGLAPLIIWIAIRHSEKWKDFVRPTLVMAILANLPGITFWITIFTGFRLLSIEGLIQRLGFIVVLIWIFFIALRSWKLVTHEE